MYTPLRLLSTYLSRSGLRGQVLGLLSLWLLAASPTAVRAQTSGIFEGYAILNVNGGGDTYYDLNGTTQGTQTGNPDLNGASLGTFEPGRTLLLRGAQLKTFKNSGDDVTSARLRYRVYAGTANGAFASLNLPFDQNLATPGDQQWQATGGTIDLIAGLPSGSYTLEVFGEISANSGPKFYSDGGANYKATFTVNNPTATTLFSESFESAFGTDPAAGFVAVNGTSANKWFRGTVPGATQGSNAAYISNDASGATHNYANTSSTTHIYREFTVAAGSPIVSLSFDWKTVGQTTLDFLRVSLTPATFTPTAGTTTTQLPSGAGVVQLFPLLNQQATYAAATYTGSLAPGTYRLVFSWRNDASTANQPPAAVDNVVVTSRAANPLTGTYTINNTLPTAGRNFASFTAAINLLNLEGTDGGAVTFEVANNQTFTENPPAITASGSAASRITFREATLSAALTDNPTIVVTGTTSTTDAGVTVTGADYLTFDGINVGVAAGSTTAEYGYLIRNTADGLNGAQNNIVRNARIVLNRASTSSVGLMQSSSTTGGGASASTSNPTVSTNRFNQYYNLTIENVYKGIYLLTGNSAAVAYDDNTQVYNNVIGGAAAGDIGGGSTATSGIQATRQNNLRLYGNTIRNVSGTTTLYGINLTENFGTSLVYNNVVTGIQNTSTSSTGILYGIYLTSDDDANTAHSLTVYNNFVSGLLHAYTGTGTTTRRVIGIDVEPGGDLNNSTIDLYHNSVRIETAAAYTASTAAFESGATTTGSILTLRNNIFANVSTAPNTTAHHAAIVSSSATVFGRSGSSSDYNDLWAPNGVVGRGSTTSYASLADWQNAYPGYGAGGTNIDANSISADPKFVSATDLHLQDSSPLNNIGTPVAAVTTDIDGEARNASNPDIGGDEFTPQTTDIAVTAINGPAVPFAAGTYPVTITVANNGSTTVTSAVISYTLNGTTTSLGTVALSLAPNASTTVSLGSLTFGDGLNRITASALNPNGNPEVAPANTTNNTLGPVDFAPALCGTYTVGTGGGFTTLDDAVTALNLGGVSCPVVFSLTDATYPASPGMVINPYVGSSSTNTVTIKPASGVQPTLSTTATATALIKLSGADNIIIDGSNTAGGTTRDLTLTNANPATATAVVWLSSQVASGGTGASSNTVKNVNLAAGADQNTGSIVTFGIVANGAAIAIGTGGAGNDNNQYQNNFVRKARYGIVSVGVAATPNQNTVISGNLVGPAAFGVNAIGKGGIVLSQDQNGQITGNEVRFVGGDLANTSIGTDRVGIALATDAAWTPTTATVSGATVAGNNVHDIVEERTFAAAGIVLAGTNGGNPTGNRVYNNFVSNVRANGTGADQTAGIGISAGNGDQVVFNSVNLTGDLDPGTATSAASSAFAFIISNTSPVNLTLQNNIGAVDVTSNTAALKHGVINIMPLSGFSWGTGGANYNNWYYNPANAQNVTGAIGTASGSSPTAVFHTTLADWRTASGQDANSKQVPAQFASTTDLHTANPALNAAGTPIAGISTDIDGDTRTSPPDIGADEFIPVATDLAAIALVTPTAAGCYSATEPVTVRLQNQGTATIDFAVSNATVSGAVTGAVAQSFGPVTVDTGTLAPNATLDVQIGTLDMTTAGTYTFTATASVVGEVNTSNNDITPVVRSQAGTAALPQQLNFTGFTGANLATLYPGWYEAQGLTLPGGGTSNWVNDDFANVTGGANGTAAKINLDAVNENGWIVGPRVTVTPNTVLSFDLALTNLNLTTAAVLDADDLFEVRISTDCGTTFGPLRTYNSTTTISNTGQNETINLGATYAGQQVIIGFFATEGATVTGDIELFVDNINLRNAPADDAGAVAIALPTTPFAPTTQPVSVQVQNFGVATLNSVTVSWTVNGVAQTPQTFTGLNLATGAVSAALPLGSFDFSVGGPRFTIVATTSLPNGNADADATNDAVTSTVTPTLTGTFTINNALPTGGSNRNFTSFTDAAQALNAVGVSGPVVFDVAAASGPYNERLVLTVISGVSATNTVTFNGNGRTLQNSTGTSAERAVVQLDGADYVTIDNLNINADVSGTTYGWGVHLINAANNNTIRNSTITSSTTSTSSTNFVGIVASASATSPTSTGNTANNLTLEGNTVVGGYYGILLNGSSGTATQGNVVRNNVVRDFYTYGIDVEYNAGPQITGNDVHRSTRTNVSTFYGVHLDNNVTNALVARNRLHDPFTGEPTATSAAYGLYISAADATAGQENTFVNNLVYNFNGNGTQYGIYHSGSDFARYYFNSISLDNTTGTGTTQTTYGFYQTVLASGLELKNNVLSVTRTGGTGSKYALYFNTTNVPFTSNYNDLFVGTGSGYVTGYANATARATLADWRTATSQDLSSVQGNPGFTSATDLTPNPANPNSYYLNGTGVQLPGFGTDFNGNPRPTTVAAGAPDLGAYEFTPTVQPNVLTSTGTYAPGGTQDFFFAGRRVASITYGAAGTLPTTLTARYYPGTNPRFPRAGTRYMNSYLELLPSADGTGFSYDLTLYYDDALLGTVDPETSLRLSRRDPATGLFYFFDQATLDATANTLVQAGLTEFGEFTGSDLAAPLPVSLTSFEAQRQGADALLTWATAQEKNNRGFEVQVSLDGRTFRTLGFVRSEAPNSTTARRYSFLDREAGKQGRRYYRLRQLDLDGAEAFFGPKSVQFDGAAAAQLAAFPNPFEKQLTLRLSSPVAQPATLIRLFDANGRTVLTRTVDVPAGASELQLTDLGQLPAGVYSAQLTLNGKPLHLKLLKQ